MYPFVFQPIIKDKIWGGTKLKTILGKEFLPLPNAGETWELSGVPGEVSKLSNGPLAGKTLVELIHKFRGALLGENVYKAFGDSFPLLIKFIDANDDLSIQVHPDDVLAKTRHNSFGKTELWYVLQADEGARLNSGFCREMDKKTYLEYLTTNRLEEVLNFEQVHAGDVFFLPAGRVHYIGKGVLLAEIQQTSDITYRIYDFDRKDDKGNKRELHTEQALAAIDYTHYGEYKSLYQPNPNTPVPIASCVYFTTNLLDLSAPMTRDYEALDSFVIFIVVEGRLTLNCQEHTLTLEKGTTVLLPAAFKSARLTPEGEAKILEVYIPR